MDRILVWARIYGSDLITLGPERAIVERGVFRIQVRLSFSYNMSRYLQEAASLHQELVEHSSFHDNLSVAQRSFVHELQILRATMKMEVRKVIGQDVVRIGPIYVRKTEWAEDPHPPFSEMFASPYSKSPPRRIKRTDPFEKKPPLYYMDRHTKWSELGIRSLFLAFISPHMENWVEFLDLRPRLAAAQGLFLRDDKAGGGISSEEQKVDDKPTPSAQSDSGSTIDCFNSYFGILNETLMMKVKLAATTPVKNQGSQESPSPKHSAASATRRIPSAFLRPFYYSKPLLAEAFVSLLRGLVRNFESQIPIPISVGSNLSMDFLVGITVEPGREKLFNDVCVYSTTQEGVYAFLPVLLLDPPEWDDRKEITGEYVGPEWQEGAAVWTGLVSHLLVYSDFRAQQLSRIAKPKPKLLRSLPNFALPSLTVRGMVTDGLRACLITWSFDPNFSRTKPTAAPYNILVDGVYKLWVEEDQQRIQQFLYDSIVEELAIEDSISGKSN